jgi:hypothetical protein
MDESKPPLQQIKIAPTEPVSNGDEPPKRRRGRPVGSKNSNSTKNVSNTALELGLSNLFGMIGTGVFLVNRYDGSVILMQADATSKALADVAKTNPKINTVLNSMVQTSSWASLATAVMPMVLAIGANHNLLPAAFKMPIGNNIPNIFAVPNVSDDGDEKSNPLDDLFSMPAGPTSMPDFLS